MKYLKLVAPIFEVGKNKEFKMDKEASDRMLRDVVVDNLWSMVTSEKGKAEGGREVKKVNSIEEMRNIEYLKERLVYSSTDIVELGDDKFKFLVDSFKIENIPVTVSKIVVELDALLKACDVQKEEEAEKEFKAQKKSGVTIKEYYESIGVKVIVEKKDSLPKGGEKK